MVPSRWNRASGQDASPVVAPRMTFRFSSAHLRRVGEISMPSRSITQSASSSPTSSTVMPISSSEAIDAAACEIAQPWPWKRRSAILPSSTTMCTPSSSPQSGLWSCELEVVRVELAEVPRVLVVVEDVVAVEVVHRLRAAEHLARAVRARATSAVDVLARVVDVEARRGPWRRTPRRAHQRLRAVVAGADADGLAVAAARRCRAGACRRSRTRPRRRGASASRGP